MKSDLPRRDFLKRAGLVAVAGTTLSACGGRPGGPLPAPDDAPAPAGDQDWDRGEVPVQYSGWAQTGAQVPHWPTLQASIDTDVLVVGAGLAGSALALHLARAGIDVTLVEARQPGWGASGRNAGHVLPFLQDLEVYKSFPDQGKAFLERFDEHRELPFQLAREYQIDCDATRSGYLNAARSERALKRFKKANRHWQGRQEIEELGPEEMRRLTGSSRYPHGLLFPSGGRINPWLFSNGMVRAAASMGARVYGDTEALTLERSGAHWRVTTPTGEITAQRVVFCTNAYPTDIVPELARSHYPLTAYALSTRPLPQELREVIMPGGQTLAQVPIDLNPLVIDEHHRLITASIPSTSRPMDAQWHWARHLEWLHRTWPETRAIPLELEAYWTGRVAMRDVDFPGVYALHPGVYGLAHFNAWGNVMAPLMARLLSEALVADDLAQLPFPMSQADPVGNPDKQNLIIRRIMIPLARTAQGLGMI